MKLFFSIICISKIAVIYSLLYVAFNFLYFYLYKKITDKFENDNNVYDDDDKEKNKNFYLCLMKSLSNILLIILYFILNKKNEENSNDDNIISKSGGDISNTNLQIQIIVFKEKKSSNINFIIILYIFICSLIDFFILFYVKQIITSGFTFFFGFIFFIFINKHTIYIHHYFGLIIILTVGIIKTIIILIKNQNQKEELIRSLVINSLLGFQIVIEKYLIEIKFVNKIIILTIEGIFELFFLVVYVFIYYKILDHKLFSNFYYLYIFILLVDLFVNFSRINSIEYNKNIVSLLFFIFSNYISSRFIKVDDKKSNKSFYFNILEIINIFGCLIIMELLVLNFCKLNKNIKPQLKKREEFDMQIIN